MPLSPAPTALPFFFGADVFPSAVEVKVKAEANTRV